MQNDLALTNNNFELVERAQNALVIHRQIQADLQQHTADTNALIAQLRQMTPMGLLALPAPEKSTEELCAGVEGIRLGTLQLLQKQVDEASGVLESQAATKAALEAQKAALIAEKQNLGK